MWVEGYALTLLVFRKDEGKKMLHRIYIGITFPYSPLETSKLMQAPECQGKLFTDNSSTDMAFQPVNYK